MHMINRNRFRSSNQRSPHSMIDNIRSIGLFKRTSAAIVSILLSPKFEMTNRYCLNGNNRFLSVEGTSRSLRVLISEEGADKNIAKFTPQRWAQFVLILILDEIAEHVKSLSIPDSKVTFRNHIGGKWYVSVTAGFKCVDIRSFTGTARRDQLRQSVGLLFDYPSEPA
jgi:hypothetical protein